MLIRSVGQVKLSYSLKYLRYLGIPLSIDEFIKKNITKPYNNALYIPIYKRFKSLIRSNYNETWSINA